MKLLKPIARKLEGMGMRMKVMMLFAIISLLCVVTVLTITSVRSSQALEKVATSQLESLGQIMVQQLDEFMSKSEIFTARLSKNRLVEGLFLSYESAFYGNGFVPGTDQNINSAQYEKLGGIYGERVASMTKDFGLANILLVSVDSQIVFSSVPDPKGLLLGRNLKAGAYKDAAITNCYKQAMASQGNQVFFSEFEYSSILGKTVAFLCTKQLAEFDHLSEGIKVGDDMGVVITELDLSRISAIMTSRRGMGATGQAYLVGDDHILRSDFFLEKESFNVDLSFKEGKTLKTESIDLALKGESGSHTVIEPTGHEAISFYTPLNVFGHRWAVIAEKRVEEVIQPVVDMLVFTGLVCLVLLVAILISCFFLAKIIVSPVIKANTTLREISDNVTSRSQGMKTNSQTLSSGAVDITRAIQSTFSVLEELTSMVKTNLEHVNASTDKGAESRSAAENGQASVKKMIDAMDHIKVSNSEIVSVMNEISDQMTEIINEINKIATKTNVINDIVFQTKLLSFNASVEAARAGEHGKGFAVVAEEVGNLASASGGAAKEISVMLENSIQKVERIVEDTKQKIDAISKTGQETVGVGTDTAKQCGEALEAILANVSDVNAKINEISHASNEQSVGIENVHEGMTQLEQITNQTSGIAQETLLSSDVLAQGAVNLNNVVSDLNSLVHGVSKVKSVGRETPTNTHSYGNHGVAEPTHLHSQGQYENTQPPVGHPGAPGVANYSGPHAVQYPTPKPEVNSGNGDQSGGASPDYNDARFPKSS